MAVGPAEILVILLVGLLVFGPQRLPEVGRQVGAALRELRKMQDAVRGELDMVLHPEHGTRSTDDAVVEPDDHSMVDPVALDARADLGIGTPETSSGAQSAAEPSERPQFPGPSDSFT